MPTSYGLSYWIHSLPRSECPTGALTRSASVHHLGRARRGRRPRQNSATERAALIAVGERGAPRSGAGVSTPSGSVTVAVAGRVGGGLAATSPGSTSTATPGCATACLHGDARRRGICSGREIELAEAAALREQALGVGLLEVAGADLGRGDVRGDGEHRRAAAVGVVEPLDEVGVAGAAGSRAHREPAGDLRLGRRRRTHRPPRCGRAPTRCLRCGGWRRRRGLRLSPTTP